MFFNSFEFAIFFAVVYSLYRILPPKGQNSMLLVASYVFYGAWDWRFLFLILLSTVIDYVVGLNIEATSDVKRRKRLVAVSVVANLSILGFFKYYDFFAASLAELLVGFGVPADVFLLQVVLPVGISFYTFQTMTYSVDIYRGLIKPTHSFPDFALFVAFFPQLVAGPIERAENLLPQVQGAREITPERNREGAWLCLWGLFKKLVIADNLAITVNAAFANSESLSGPEVLAVAYAFAFQIYCDFSGYTDIARGVAKLLGFELMVNFRAPFLADSPADFWSRWHISLSTWLRDYLYIPLGGNRKGELKTYRNLMLTMILGGLWHGAAWTFVLWGVYQGLALVIHRRMRPWLSDRLGAGFGWSFLRVFGTFQLMAFGWLIFRSETFEQLRTLTAALFTDWTRIGTAGDILIAIAAYAWPLMLFQALQVTQRTLTPQFRWHPTLQTALYSLVFYLIFVYGSIQSNQFIYFQF